MHVPAVPVLALAALAAPAVAQGQAPLQARADQLLALLDGKATPESVFAPAFLAQVPSAKVTEI